MFQWILADKEKWTQCQKVILLCLADALLYMVCSIAGFVSLLMAYRVADQINEIHSIQASTSAILIFLVIFGFLGIAGQLPYLIQQGKLPFMSTK